MVSWGVVAPCRNTVIGIDQHVEDYEWSEWGIPASGMII